MKNAFVALTVLALANLVAVIAFLGWLGATDRLDSSRVRQIREVLAPTISQEKAKEVELQQQKTQVEQDANAKAKLARPATTSEQELAARLEQTEIDRQRGQRLRDEHTQLQRSIAEMTAWLEDLRTQVATARREFEAVTKGTRDAATDQQFKKTLGVLSGLKADKAKAALTEIMGATPEGKAQVVTYINAMDEEVRTKVVQEFLKDDPKLAAELLEMLRTRGIPPTAPGVSPK